MTHSLQTVFLHITNACNRSCIYCYSNAGRSLPDELSAHELKALCPELIAIIPRKIVITGGEPLLRTDLPSFLEELNLLNVKGKTKICLNTNGAYVTASMARILAKKVHEVRVSLDGPQDINDKCRGYGSYNDAMNAIENLRHAGARIKIIVTATSYNASHLGKWITFLLSQGLKSINIKGAKPIGRCLESLDLLVSDNLLVDAVNTNLAPFQCSFNPTAKVSLHSSNCGIGQFINIMPNGDIYPCHVLCEKAFWCGNVRSTKLSSVCEKHTILGKLRSVSYESLVERYPEFGPMLQSKACLGDRENIKEMLKETLCL